MDSGILGVDRGPTELYQEYRLRVIKYWTLEAERLLVDFHIDSLVSEILPVRGFNNMAQPLLAASAITAIQTVAFSRGHGVIQIGATTVKKRIGGGGKATKVKVRNGVLNQFPALVPRKKDWVKVFDEPDAIAIGLAYLSL